MAKARRDGFLIKKGNDSWSVGFSAGRDRNGKRVYHRETVRGTKTDAQKRLTQMLSERDKGTFTESSGISVNDYCDRWLNDAVKSQLSPRTFNGYTRLLERYVRKLLGHKRLDKLQVLDIQKVYSGMLARGLSGRTIRHAHAALHTALEQAVRWNLIFRNPASLVVLPKVQHTERRVLSPEEATRFVQVADEMPRGLIFEFALLTGMRPEEYLAIKWPDLDLERGTAQVQRALVRINNGWSFEPTKTKKSRRTITLPSPLIAKLRAHRREQNEWRLKNGSEWQPHDLVFCGETGAPHSVPNLTYRYFRPILKKAGIPQIRLYDLRHSCATLLLIAEENPKVVSERLGIVDPKI